MTPAETLIACSPCAKAKARCDKRLPTCSRCLFKRQKCRPRQPRRYQEAFQLVNSDSQPSLVNQTLSSAPSQPASTVAASPFDLNAFPPQAMLGTMLWPDGTNASDNPEANMLSEIPGGAFAEQYGPLPSSSTIMSESGPLSFDFDLSNNSYYSIPPDHHNNPLSSILASDLSSFLEDGATLPPSVRPEQRENPEGDFDADLPSFKCNPRVQRWINPRAGGEHLLRLEKTLDQLPSWRNSFPVDVNDPDVRVEKLEDSIRDRLMVIAQGFFSRARDMRQASHWDANPRQGSSMAESKFTGHFVLPSTSVLEDFLRMYSSRVEPYIPFFPGKKINATELLRANNEKIAVLLLLLMIAHGAMASPIWEAHEFAHGLIEICRVCIFDVVEKNVQMTAHPVTMRCALLYLQASAWSGTRWHMDLSAAYIHSFTSMLKYARLLDAKQSSLPEMSTLTDPEGAWNVWCQEEQMNRLIYGWVIFDQEMSLFYDRSPDLDIEEIFTVLPANENLWTATTAETWVATYLDLQKTNNLYPGHQSNEITLSTLFSQFMNGELSQPNSQVSHFEIHLLLHPLQATIYHLYKSFSHCFHTNSQRHLHRFLTQLEEIHYLLNQWHSLSRRTLPSHADLSTPQIICNTVLYHLISLNALAHIPDIEKFARDEILLDHFCESVWTGKRYRENATSIWRHGGQVLRLFTKLPPSARPYWWCASIYRVGLAMWGAGVAARWAQESSGVCVGTEHVAVDELEFEHPDIVRLMRNRDGIPVVRRGDGVTAVLHEPGGILKYCIGVLGECEGDSELARRLRSRLVGLYGRVGMGAG